MRKWYEFSTSGYLNDSIDSKKVHGLNTRLNTFFNDSMMCQKALTTNKIEIGYGSGVEDNLFYDIDLNKQITLELQNETINSSNTALSCYLAAIHPLLPLSALRKRLVESGISTKRHYENINNRGTKMVAPAMSFYTSLALYPAVKSSADFDGAHIDNFRYFYISSVSLPNKYWHSFWLDNLREPLLDLIYSELSLEEANESLISMISILSRFDFSDFELLSSAQNNEEEIEDFF
jgi:hypothetical protein